MIRLSSRLRIVYAAVAILAIAGVAFWIAARSTPERTAALQAPEGVAVPLADAPALATLPIERWTPRLLEFRRAEAWGPLRGELEDLRQRKSAEFERYRLGYLLARILIQLEEYEQASRELAPFLAAGNPFRPLARHHEIEIASALGDAGRAAQLRETFILDETDSIWREQQIETQLDYLQEEDPAGLLRFAEKLRPSASTALRRELDGRSAEALREVGRPEEAIQLALRILRGGTGDDPSERAFQLVDRPDILARLKPEDAILVGDSARDHRHFERAVEIHDSARARAPGKEADLLFSIGRSWFGSEEYAKAEEVYLSGAARAAGAEQKAIFYYHASRAAQLLGDDDRAIRHMTRAIAVPGRFGSTAASLTQRMRTHLKQGNTAAGIRDLRMIERLWPRGESRVEAAIQLSTYLIAGGRESMGLRELGAIPLSLTGPWEESEIDYWKARALEASDPARALGLYLDVMRYDVPSHFAYFARQRTRLPALSAARAAHIETARKRAADAIAAGNWNEARRHATEAMLITGSDEDRDRLVAIYREIPSYREVLELEPEELPALPIEIPAEGEFPRGDLLMALGLHDEASPEIRGRWGLRPLRAGLTRSHALNLAAESRDSIYAIEVMMNGVSDDFVPELLPRRVRELLYPRYFYGMIEREADRHGADPRLVLSIMREESRFNPRAKSAAAARGLLQFIITTARDISQSLGITELESGDLYDPATIIQLGARYVANLLEEFANDPYRAAAAYNAGPHQTRLWARIQPADGPDYFLSSVNFVETKGYVRKVLNSYFRYGEIYEGMDATGGTRAEP